MIAVSRAWLLLCAIFLVSAAPAHAALQLCNRTSYVLYAAEGASAKAQTVTQGWTRIVPGDCATPIKEALTAQAFYLYAKTSQAHSGAARAWGGNIPLCVRDTNFQMSVPIGSQACGDDGFTVPFAPLNTHRQASWTATLTESNAINSDDAARAAGFDRLLHDLGYKNGDAKARDAALKTFRTKMKLSPKAGNTGLFDALETAAMKASSPAGYSLCNDTAGVVWAALGFHAGKDTLAAGWWKIAAGACARALTEPLKLDKVYVHAEGHNKPGLVSGSEKFCIANVTFQVSGAGDCAKRGLKDAGFAPTDTRGVAGYTAHIGNNGLMTQVAMPK